MSFLRELCRSTLARTFLTETWIGPSPWFFQHLNKCSMTRTPDFLPVSQQKSEQKPRFCRFSNSLLILSSVTVRYSSMFYSLWTRDQSVPNYSPWSNNSTGWYKVLREKKVSVAKQLYIILIIACFITGFCRVYNILCT